MADVAVQSPVTMEPHEISEDVDMADDTASTRDVQTESTNGATTQARPEAPPARMRPKLDLSGLTDAAGTSRKGSGERRKGKSIFGQVLGTLNKAKIEDKQRMASDAAKKRQEIDARLQAKLAREQSIVRKQDESRKDRLAALRKQEDLSIKDSILKHRYATIPHLSNFLLTTDVIPRDVEMNDEDDNVEKDLAIAPKPSHPPALYYLPKILTPAQEAFVSGRRRRAERRVQEEREEWEKERSKGAEEVRALKEAAEVARAQATEAQKSALDGGLAREASPTPANGDTPLEPSKDIPQDREVSSVPEKLATVPDVEQDAIMGVDDDAVEY